MESGYVSAGISYDYHDLALLGNITFPKQASLNYRSAITVTDYYSLRILYWDDTYDLLVLDLLTTTGVVESLTRSLLEYIRLRS